MSEVALIRKEKPEWQRNKLNGIGGKIEPGETSYAAMVREFREETGAVVVNWTSMVTLTCGDAVIHFFRSELTEVRTTTNELVEWHPVSGATLNPRSIPNLKWLIPMAADRDLISGTLHSGFSG